MRHAWRTTKKRGAEAPRLIIELNYSINRLETHMQCDRRILVAAIIVVGVLKDDCRAASKALAHVKQPWRFTRTGRRPLTSARHQEIQTSVAQTATDAKVRGFGPAPQHRSLSSWNGPDKGVTPPTLNSTAT